jgi:N-acetylmuramoyl-L-alanine amidase
LWYDADIFNETAIDSSSQTTPLLAPATTLPDSTGNRYALPPTFNPQDALRIIGYDTSNLDAAIRAFKRHFIQKEVNAILTDDDKKVLYNLYRKYF